MQRIAVSKEPQVKRYALGVLLIGALSLFPPAFADDDGEPNFSGNASWYGVPFHGRKTASGEIFDMNKLSGAHKTLPLISKVLVENPRTGKSTVVRVNDRGPFVKTRVMDLSREGARKLGYLEHGTAYLDFTLIRKSATVSKASSSTDDDAKQSDAKKSDVNKSDANK